MPDCAIDFERLAEPFEYQDVEFRVQRSGIGRSGLFVVVVPYVTARAIQTRLDRVCGPTNWQLERPILIADGGKPFCGCGISIRVGDEWITKWDVSDGTHVEAAKGGYSTAMKRAACQWNIGRYMYHLDELWLADDHISEDRKDDRYWHYASVKTDDGKKVYWWKNPPLPAWALPKTEIEPKDLNDLVLTWRKKFASTVESKAERQEMFTRWVHELIGTDFPVGDFRCWTRPALNKCHDQIKATDRPNGISGNTPFSDDE